MPLVIRVAQPSLTLCRSSLSEHAKVIAFCRREAIDLVVVGPEAPLVSGLADDLIRRRHIVLRTDGNSARLEGSKGYAKDFCREFEIPTADFRRFRNSKEAKAYIREVGAPIVVKADGLAAGKGVVVARTVEEAEVAVDTLLTSAGTLRERKSSLKSFSKARRSRSSPCAMAQCHAFLQRAGS